MFPLIFRTQIDTVRIILSPFIAVMIALASMLALSSCGDDAKDSAGSTNSAPAIAPREIDPNAKPVPRFDADSAYAFVVDVVVLTAGLGRWVGSQVFLVYFTGLARAVHFVLNRGVPLVAAISGVD